MRQWGRGRYKNRMARLSKTQLTGSFLLLAFIVSLLLIKYFRVLWWAR
jgi:hypothetical protein